MHESWIVEAVGRVRSQAEQKACDTDATSPTVPVGLPADYVPPAPLHLRNNSGGLCI